MKLIAHIGHGKTGTSSIQKTLASSKDSLREAGIVYLGLNLEFSPVKLYPWQIAGGWPDLIRNGRENAQQQLTEVLEETLDQLHEDGATKVIWSNEAMLSRCDIVGPVLQNLRSEHDSVEIILYLRRHDAWARSAYLQWGIKHKAYRGKVMSFPEWLKTHPISFSKPVAPWLDQSWDNVCIRNFDVCEDVVADFFSCCAIPENLLASRRDNESPETVALALWALFNSQREEPTLPYELQPLLQQAEVINKKYQHLDLNALFPKSDELRNLLNSVQGDIEAVNEIFKAFGQPPFGDTPLKDKDFQVTYEQIFAALLDIVWLQHSKYTAQNIELRKLKRRMTRLERNLLNKDIADD